MTAVSQVVIVSQLRVTATSIAQGIGCFLGRPGPRRRGGEGGLGEREGDASVILDDALVAAGVTDLDRDGLTFAGLTSTAVLPERLYLSNCNCLAVLTFSWLTPAAVHCGQTHRSEGTLLSGGDKQ